MAEYKMGNSGKGYEALKILCNDFNEGALGCIGETWNPETDKPTGCLNQLWGSAMPIRIIDEFVLGIKADAENKTIYFSPQFPENTARIARHIRLGMETAWITVEKKGNNYSVSSSNRHLKTKII